MPFLFLILVNRTLYPLMRILSCIWTSSVCFLIYSRIPLSLRPPVSCIEIASPKTSAFAFIFNLRACYRSFSCFFSKNFCFRIYIYIFVPVIDHSPACSQKTSAFEFIFNLHACHRSFTCFFPEKSHRSCCASAACLPNIE